MNTIKGYVCIILGILAPGCALLMGSPSVKSKASAEVSKGFDITFVFPWIKSGKILHQKCDFLHGRFDAMIYETKDGRHFYLQGRMDSMNIVLAGEVKKEDALQFLETKMTDFIQALMSDPIASSWLVTENYVQGMPADEQEILKPYIINEKKPYVSNKKDMTVSQNEWVMNLNVATKYGAIESWSISGTVDPLVINTFCRKIIKPRGTLRELKKDEILGDNIRNPR
jgi:hypothetical protein